MTEIVGQGTSTDIQRAKEDVDLHDQSSTSAGLESFGRMISEIDIGTSVARIPKFIKNAYTLLCKVTRFCSSLGNAPRLHLYSSSFLQFAPRYLFQPSLMMTLLPSSVVAITNFSHRPSRPAPRRMILSSPIHPMTPFGGRPPGTPGI
jgi:hypothetical protein